MVFLFLFGAFTLVFSEKKIYLCNNIISFRLGEYDKKLYKAFQLTLKCLSTSKKGPLEYSNTLHNVSDFLSNTYYV